MSPTTPMAPTAWPAESWIGAATLDSPSTASSRSRARPRLAHGLELLAQRGGGERPLGELGERLGGQVVEDLIGRVGEHRLAQRAGVGGQLGADLEHLEGGVGAEDVVDDDDRGAVQHADADGRLRAGGEPVGVDERARAQLVVVEVGVAEVQQPGAELVLVASRGPARRSRAPAASGAARGRSAAHARAGRRAGVTPSRRGPEASAFRMRAARSTDWIVPAGPTGCVGIDLRSALSNRLR